MTKTTINQVNLFFPSVADQLADSLAPMKINGNEELRQRHVTNSNASWHGVDGGAATVRRLIAEGYPEGRAKVERFHETLTASLPRAVGIRRQKRRGEFGDDLDYHAMLRGCNDKSWTRSTRHLRKGGAILRLCVDICGNGDAKHDSLAWRGIAGLSLAEIMTKAGYSVEIVAAMGVKNPAGYRSDLNLTVSTVVKPRHAQTDLDLLAAVVALPAYFRTIGFTSIVRVCDNEGKAAESGLGNYLDVSGVLPVPDKVTQLFVSGDVRNEETARKWINDSLTLLQGATS